MRIQYQLEDGKIEALDIPVSAKEIRFTKFCDFRNARATFEDDTLPSEEYAAQLVAGLNHLVPGIRAASIPFSLEEDWDANLVDTGYKIKIGDNLSKMRIYAHVVNTINGYQVEEVPETFVLTHKGLDFKILKRRVASAMLNRTTGEMIETLEYQRRATQLMEGEQRRDFGNIDFELGLTEIAILCRQEGEELPADKPGRDAFIAKRRNLFKTLDLGTIIEMRYFFLKALVESETTRTTVFSGKARRVLTIESGRKRRWSWPWPGRQPSNN